MRRMVEGAIDRQSAPLRLASGYPPDPRLNIHRTYRSSQASSRRQPL
jgi:hypothetical protein